MLRLEQLARELVTKLKATAMHESHYAELARVLHEIELERESFVDLIGAARDIHTSDDVEIDDYPLLSVADEGVWVSAWVWVRRDTDDDEEDEVQP